jgi:hypothetical protein
MKTIAATLASILILGCGKEPALYKSAGLPIREEKVLQQSLSKYFEGMGSPDAIFAPTAWDFGITVQEGDSLWKIAEEIYADGTRWTQVYSWNDMDPAVYKYDRYPDKGNYRKMRTPEDIVPGQRLRVFIDAESVDSYFEKHPERRMAYWDKSPYQSYRDWPLHLQ